VVVVEVVVVVDVVEVVVVVDDATVTGSSAGEAPPQPAATRARSTRVALRGARFQTTMDANLGSPG